MYPFPAARTHAHAQMNDARSYAAGQASVMNYARQAAVTAASVAKQQVTTPTTDFFNLLGSAYNYAQPITSKIMGVRGIAQVVFGGGAAATAGYSEGVRAGVRSAVDFMVPGYFKRDQPVSTQSRKASQVQSAAQPVSSSNGTSTGGGGGGVVEEPDHGWVVLLLGLAVLGGMRR